MTLAHPFAHPMYAYLGLLVSAAFMTYAGARLNRFRETHHLAVPANLRGIGGALYDRQLWQALPPETRASIRRVQISGMVAAATGLFLAIV